LLEIAHSWRALVPSKKEGLLERASSSSRKGRPRQRWTPSTQTRPWQCGYIRRHRQSDSGGVNWFGASRPASRTATRDALPTASRDDLNQAQSSLAPKIYLAKMILSLSWLFCSGTCRSWATPGGLS